MEFTNSSSTGSNYQSTYSVGNDSSSFQQTNPAHSNQSDGDMPSSVSDQPNQEDEGPDSSIENVIPLQKLKRGWFAVSGFVMNKASEVYNSEQVQHIKQKTAEVVVPALEKTAEVVKPAWEKTTEVVTPAWQKTVDAATPLWEQTKATTSVVIEKTRENVNIATEKVKPTVKNVSENVSLAAQQGWEQFSHAASSAAEFTAEEVHKIASKFDSSSSSFEQPRSAMDAATQGRPMNV